MERLAGLAALAQRRPALAAIVLGLIAERTGSIVPSVLLHAMFNAVSVFILLAQPGRGAATG
jgi:membrane protease YdiL (CAAX protease family)